VQLIIKKILRAYVLTRLPPLRSGTGSTPADEAYNLCKSLVDQVPPPKDVQTLKLLEKTLLALGKTDDLGLLHEKLYRAKVSTPGRTGGADEDLAQEWFGACVRVGDYNGMQKVCASRALNLSYQLSQYSMANLHPRLQCICKNNSLPIEHITFGPSQVALFSM